MRAYLDPDSILFSDAQWIDMSFVDRFADAVQFLQLVRDNESKISCFGQGVKFHFSEEILEQLYSSNPALNVPPRPHYYIQFKNVILPELLRRASVCAGDACHPVTVPSVQAVPADDQSLNDLLFADHLNTCLGCSRVDSKCVLRSERCSIANENEVFEISASLSTVSTDILMDPLETLPRGDEENRLARLEQAIISFIAISSLTDGRWQGKPLQKIEIGDEFWATYRQAQFHLSKTYAYRLCNVLAQLVTGLYLDTNAHGMAPEKFVHGGKSIAKWNAYIFKMGPDAQDKRCSRLYFGYSGGSLVLYRYEADAH